MDDLCSVMTGLIGRRPVIIPTSSADKRGRVSGWTSLTNEKRYARVTRVYMARSLSIRSNRMMMMMMMVVRRGWEDGPDGTYGVRIRFQYVALVRAAS